MASPDYKHVLISRGSDVCAITKYSESFGSSDMYHKLRDVHNPGVWIRGVPLHYTALSQVLSVIPVCHIRIACKYVHMYVLSHIVTYVHALHTPSHFLLHPYWPTAAYTVDQIATKHT